MEVPFNGITMTQHHDLAEILGMLHSFTALIQTWQEAVRWRVGRGAEELLNPADEALAHKLTPFLQTHDKIVGETWLTIGLWPLV